MLLTDAQKLAAAIEERINAGRSSDQAVTTTVKTQSQQSKFTAPGGGRPTFIRYHIEVADRARVAALDLDQASALLDDMEPDWGPDQLFDAIRSRGLPVETAS